MTKQDLKTIQKHLLNYMAELKIKSLKELDIENIVELEVEIMSVKKNIKKIGELVR